MSEVEVRPFQAEDGPLLSEIVHKSFSVEWSSRFWQWKYLESPCGKASTYLILADGKVVALSGQILQYVSLNGEKVLASVAVDNMRLPGYEKKGGGWLKAVRLAVKEACSRGAPFIYSIANELSMRASQVLKYEAVFSLQSLRLPLNVSTHLLRRFGNNKLIRSMGKSGDMLFGLFDTFGRRSENMLRHSKWDVHEVKSFDNNFTALWEKVKDCYGITAWRDAEYLNWRYIAIPEVNYKIFCVSEYGDPNPSGYIVLKCEEEMGIKRGYIIDIIVQPNEKESFYALLARAVSFFREAEMDAVYFWVNKEAWIFSWFREAGFSPIEIKQYLVVKSYSDSIPQSRLMEKSGWYITRGDSDYL